LSAVEGNGANIASSAALLPLRWNLFELQDLGAQDLKGISSPVRAWQHYVQLPLRAFDALHATRLTQLVGREEELELLLRRWSKAKAGEGQVVLLSGEPGIGKSSGVDGAYPCSDLRVFRRACQKARHGPC
jgi:predicted AAA+ superfamily ATPase